jgi:hypothetical protein
MKDENKASMKKGLLLYFILAIGITWVFWIPSLMIADVNDYFLPQIGAVNKIIQEGFQDNLHIILYILNQIGVYGPFIAALITLFIMEGKGGIKSLFKRMGKWRIRPIWYGIIIVIPLILSFGTLGLSALLGASLSSAFNLINLGFPVLLLIFLENLLTSGLEEPGWRGYALPKLRNKYNAYNSSIILGIIWAIWHYPVVYYLNIASGLFLTILAIAGFTALMTFGSVIYSWIYLNTESIFLLIIFHALQNFFPYLIMSGVLDPLGGFSDAIITLILVFIIVKKYGEEKLTGKNKKEASE